MDVAIAKIIDEYPSPGQLLALSEVDLERIVLRYVVEISNDPMCRMATRDALSNGLFERGGYEYDATMRTNVARAIARAWKAIENDALIEEPDSYNGKNGYRIASPKGREANSQFDFAAAKARNQFSREMFHPSLPDAAWNALRAGDHDTAVFEAFKGVESAVRKKAGLGEADFGWQLMEKAFDPDNGPLTDKTARKSKRVARRDLFKGAFGEIRNPKAHGDPTITDPQVAVEEMMTAATLQRIVDSC